MRGERTSGRADLSATPEKGAKMLRVDLPAAGIPYRDVSGLCIRLPCAPVPDSDTGRCRRRLPRVIQKMMRHSTLELTGRYTRPRAVDIEAAAA